MQNWKTQLIVGAALTAFVLPAPLDAQVRGRAQGKVDEAAPSKAEGPAPSKAERADREAPRPNVAGRGIPQKYEEPAFARGYAAGRELGLADARNGERYDPVASREYRDGDRGYVASYGSRDAYKSNYRAGFRQGYEEGYRKN